MFSRLFRRIGIPFLFLSLMCGQTWSTVHYVKPGGIGNGDSWDNASGNLQTVINITKPGEEIWVASGTYNEVITMASGIALYGNFDGTETAREQRDWLTNPSVLDANGLTGRAVTIGVNGTVIDGFTITGGSEGGVAYNHVTSATMTNCIISGNSVTTTGGGVYLASSSPTLTNCILTGNSAANGGGGVYCHFSSPMLIDCMLSGNLVTSFGTGGGLSCSSSTSSPTLIRCQITSNGNEGHPMFANGGGIYGYTITLTDCSISNNYAGAAGGGLYCYSATVNNCTISGNAADGEGGGVFQQSQTSAFTNCMVTHNTSGANGGGFFIRSATSTFTKCMISANSAAESGGGVFCYSSSPTLVHCTLSRNTADSFVGGLYGAVSSPTLTNCILWNTGAEILVSSGTPKVTYSCVQGGFAGNGNIDDYPEFVNPGNSDWRLADLSPCINRGTDVGLPFQGTAPDMGAWESPASYTQGPIDSTPKRLYVNESALAGGDGLSWAAAFQKVAEALSLAPGSTEIWVAKGTYPESIHLEPAVSLYGGFKGTETARDQRNWVSNPAILDVTGMGGRTVTVGAVEGTVLDGFTIRGGTEEYGGGIAYCSVNTGVLSQCVITHNNSHFHGGGVFCTDSSPTLSNCLITENTTDGYNSGVCCLYSSPTLINCTIVGNATAPEGTFYCYLSSPVLTNCILWNPAAEFYLEGTGSSPVVNYSCVDGGYTGSGNISDHPLFVDAIHANYHLQELSPCVGKGIGPSLNTLVPLLDMDGDPRSGPVCDMGADEYTTTTGVSIWRSY